MNDANTPCSEWSSTEKCAVCPHNGVVRASTMLIRWSFGHRYANVFTPAMYSQLFLSVQRGPRPEGADAWVKLASGPTWHSQACMKPVHESGLLTAVDSLSELQTISLLTQSPPAVKIQVKLAPTAWTKRCRTSITNGQTEWQRFCCKLLTSQVESPDLGAAHTEVSVWIQTDRRASSDQTQNWSN